MHLTTVFSYHDYKLSEKKIKAQRGKTAKQHPLAGSVTKINERQLLFITPLLIKKDERQKSQVISQKIRKT